MHRIPDEDIARVLYLAKKESRRDYVFLLLVANTGLRVSEAVGLNVGDCYGLRKHPPYISIRTAKRRPPREDDVYLAVKIGEELRGYVQPMPYSEQPERISLPVFRSRKRTRLSKRQGQRIFQNYATLAGLPPRRSIHDLRSSFASRIADATGDPFLVKQALRHGRIETSRFYVESSIRRYVEALDRTGLVLPDRGTVN